MAWSLPTAGYLFKDKIDTANIIDPHDMGLMLLQARRKGKLESFHSPEKHMKQVKHMRIQMEHKKVGRPEMDTQMWGDDINKSSTWLKIDLNGHLWILFYNVHVIS